MITYHWSISLATARQLEARLGNIPASPTCLFRTSGKADSRLLGERLAGLAFARVFVSPLLRAQRTSELSGFDKVAEIEPDLVEWNYGAIQREADGRDSR